MCHQRWRITYSEVHKLKNIVCFKLLPDTKNGELRNRKFNNKHLFNGMHIRIEYARDHIATWSEKATYKPKPNSDPFKFV